MKVAPSIKLSRVEIRESVARLLRNASRRDTWNAEPQDWYRYTERPTITPWGRAHLSHSDATLTTFHAWSPNDGKIEIFFLVFLPTLSLSQRPGVVNKLGKRTIRAKFSSEIPAANSFHAVCSKRSSSRTRGVEIGLCAWREDFLFVGTKLSTEIYEDFSFVFFFFGIKDWL